MPAKPAKTDLASPIRKAMTDDGLSWPELAHLSGLTVPQISHFLSGDKRLALTQASKVCDALGLRWGSASRLHAIHPCRTLSLRIGRCEVDVCWTGVPAMPSPQGGYRYAR